MVRVVEESQAEYCYQGYLENNRDLARKVSELEHQLGLSTQEIHFLRSITHQKNVRILELENQVNELQQYKAKHDFIKDIILGDRPVEPAPLSIIHQTTSIQAITDSEHVGTSRKEDDSCQQEEYSENSTRDMLQPIAEKEEEEAEEEEERQEYSERTDREELEQEDEEEYDGTLEAIEEEGEEEDEEGAEKEKEEKEVSKEYVEDEPIQDHDHEASSATPTPIEDSLEPVNVTYVPPIDKPERTCHTPSIWNCLDSVESDKSSVKSTPRSPVRSVLKISKTMNSSSPIHPIVNRGPLNEDVFHSTPVQPARVAKPKPKRTNQRSENEAPCTRYNLRKRAKVAN